MSLLDMCPPVVTLASHAVVFRIVVLPSVPVGGRVIQLGKSGNTTGGYSYAKDLLLHVLTVLSCGSLSPIFQSCLVCS